MSLKHFHILFIVISVALTLGFAAWALLTARQPVSTQVMGGISGVLGLALLVYGVWFLKKSKNVII